MGSKIAGQPPENQPMTGEPEAPQAAPAPSLNEQLLAAFAARDLLAQQSEPEEAAVKVADELIRQLVMQYEPEQFPASEPVLSQLASLAKRRLPIAVRLLLQPREKLTLFQAPEGEKQLPTEHFGLNGLTFELPRGVWYDVPALVGEIIRQSSLR